MLRFVIEKAQPIERSTRFMIIHPTTSGQRGNGQNVLARFLIVCLGLVLVSVVIGCDSAGQAEDEVVVFAAASAQAAVQEVASKFQAEHGIAISLNFAASGSLAQQIMAGAGADVFISASERWVDEVSAEGLADVELTKPLMSNSLVIIAQQSTDWQLDSIEQLSELSFRYLLVGDPDFVPAGKYTKQFLQSSIVKETKSSLWDLVEGRICPTTDLRRILALVEADRSLLGAVYRTDTANSQTAKVIYQVPPSEVTVNYFLVRLKASQETPNRSDNTTTFVDYLYRESSLRIFDRFGFGVPAE